MSGSELERASAHATRWWVPSKVTVGYVFSPAAAVIGKGVASTSAPAGLMRRPMIDVSLIPIAPCLTHSTQTASVLVPSKDSLGVDSWLVELARTNPLPSSIAPAGVTRLA